MDIRPLTMEDLPQVLIVQEESYPDALLESEGCFARKLALFPGSCLGVFEDRDLVGYIFTQPWISGEIVSLHDEIPTAHHAPDCFYIHDLAVLRSRRGHGIARMLLERTFRMAGSRELHSLALVAVNRSEPFWERYGFRRQHTLTYSEGITATYMIRSARDDSSRRHIVSVPDDLSPSEIDAREGI